jgi:hypothetical protein
MVQHFIVVKTFGHQIDCFCPGSDHADYLTINKSDIIEVTNDRKFTIGNGWYFLVVINSQCFFYMALEDLDKYFMKGKLLSILDIELKINNLQFHVDKALDIGDEVTFLNYTKKLKESNDLRVKLEEYLRNNKGVNHIS